MSINGKKCRKCGKVNYITRTRTTGMGWEMRKKSIDGREIIE